MVLLPASRCTDSNTSSSCADGDIDRLWPAAVTRYFATACLLTSLAVKLSLTSPYTLALLWPQVLKLEVRCPLASAT